MIDYYKILDVPMTAQSEEIVVAIKDKRRLWLQKTNAPQLERRQEAEVKVKQIDEAEKILLDSSKRSEYDKKLKTSSKTDERTVDEEELRVGDELVRQGWEALISDNVADAIYIGTKATEKQGDNPEAWALLAQAKYRWGEIEDSIYEYKKAIKLRPNNPEYYFDLGSVYESQKRWQDAVNNYEKASKIDPKVSVYRAAIGQVYLRVEMYEEAIKILEDCVKEEPNNTTYNWFLAIAYNDLVMDKYMVESKIYEGKCYLATEQAAELALKYFNKAVALKFEDKELEALIRKNIEGAEWSLSKHWGRSIGSTLKWALILGIGGIILFTTGNAVIVFIVLVVWALWVYLGFKEGYKIHSDRY